MACVFGVARSLNPANLNWRLGKLCLALCGVATVAMLPPAARADIDPLSGIDLVRITHTGNAPWQGNGTPGDRAIGRGQVNHEYRIGRFEVTTEQWVEFFNAAYDRPVADRIPHLTPPNFWGAVGTAANTPGGLRWRVPGGNELRPVGNISWRMAAIYANWLHNGKSTDRAAFLSGSYDVSTFGFTPTGRFTDQLTHDVGARYWIPTWDEWLKAAHYDPDKPNTDGTTGGWWSYSNASDEPTVGGPPGTIINGQPATANFGWDAPNFPGQSPFTVPLGAYASVASPWGLRDVAGATGEWTEEALFSGIPGELSPVDRAYEGSQWSSSALFADRLGGFGGSDFPSYSGLYVGLRIASNIPSPGACSLGLGLFAIMQFPTAQRTKTV